MSWAEHKCAAATFLSLGIHHVCAILPEAVSFIMAKNVSPSDGKCKCENNLPIGYSL